MYYRILSLRIILFKLFQSIYKGIKIVTLLSNKIHEKQNLHLICLFIIPFCL